MNQTMKLPLEKIVPDTAYQPRDRMNNEHIEHLVYSDPFAWPPVLVTPQADGSYLLIDGFHRHKAAELLGLTSLQAEIREDADILTAYEANLKNGLPLTKAEREQYVLLLHEAQPKLSQRELGKAAGLSQSTVSRLLDNEADNNANESPSSWSTGKTQSADKPDELNQILTLLYQAYIKQAGINKLAQFFSGKSDAQQRAEYIAAALGKYDEADQETMATAIQTIGQTLVDGASLRLKKLHAQNE